MKSKINELINSSERPTKPTHQFDDEIEIKPTKGLKLDNASSVVNKPKPRIDIMENANKIMADRDLQKKLGWELTTKLLTIFKDKTLKENKDNLYIEAENNVLKDYVDFVRLVNNDETQEEGMGTVGFAIAIARCALLQRDRLNELEYMMSNLSKQVSLLKSKEENK